MAASHNQISLILERRDDADLLILTHNDKFEILEIGENTLEKSD